MKSLTQYNLMSARGAGSGAGPGGGRRGNTMVLVAGILVLLVIIATAFITRSHTSRMIASSQLAASKRTETSHAIGDSLAQIISEHLFVRKIIWSRDVVFDPFLANDANRVRQRLYPTTVRYSFDSNGLGGNDDFPFNFAPFQVVPYTNWPDAGSFGHVAKLPSGPGNNSTIPPAAGSFSLFLDPEGNPIGNPGFGDTRWLRDLEPLRIDTSSLGDSDFQRLDSFSHWRHMTNISHANNAFRICRDIANIFNDPDPLRNTFGGLVLELNLPVEQWLADPVPNAPLTNFFPVWDAWFSPNYFDNYIDPSGLFIPPNFYRLSDLDNDGILNEPGERPSNEFDFGTDRNVVSRILADADGDGFTDSFWFLAPTTPDNGIRQIVGVSITDNSGRLNVNVATRFRRDDNRILIGPFFGDPVGQEEVDLFVDPTAVAQFRQRTIGATPADLALVGDFILNANRALTFSDPGNDFVGFLDSLHNWEQAFPALVLAIDNDDSPYGGTSMEWDFDMWEVNPNSFDNRQPENFLGAIGVLTYDSNDGDSFPDRNPSFNTNLFRQSDRLRYWLNAASRPFDAKLGLTPFGTNSELELRMYEGQNYPWIVSSFENAVQNNVHTQTGFQIMHGNLNREESSEYLDQLNAGELLFDPRRKLTMFSSARNDLMPPWLWWRWNELPEIVQADALADTTDIEDNQGNEMINGNGEVDVIDRFFAQARNKLDLREPDPRGFDMLFGTPDDRFFFSGQYNFDVRLAQTLMLAFTDGPMFHSSSNTMKGKSYLGDYEYPNNPAIATGIDDPVNEVRKLAASYAANIRAYRDSDSQSTLVEAEPLPQLAALPRDRITSVIAGPETERTRFLGMEKQPFLVEAFVGHVYRTVQAEFRHPAQNINPGDNVLCVDGDHNDPVLVIQIANPYDTDLDLAGFALKIFDQTSRVLLEGNLGMLAPNEKRTYFLIDPNVAGDPGAGERWEKTLQLSDPVTGFPFTNVVDLLDPLNLDLFVDANGVQNNSPWPATDRSAYDGKNEERSIELVKFDNSLPPGIDVFEVVVDRFDMPTSTDPQEQTGLGTSITVDLLSTAPQADCFEPRHPVDPINIFVQWPLARAIDTTHMVFSTRATRAWDVDPTDFDIDPNQLKNPRFIFHDRKIVDEYIDGFGYNDAEFDVNTPTLWFDTAFAGIQIQIPMHDHERPRFNTRHKFYSGQDSETELDGSGGRLETFSLQMLQKDANFDQVGELLNVWLFSHELRFIESVPGFFILDNTNPLDGGTVRTFSEYLAQENDNLVGDDIRVNRLRVLPISINGQVISPVIDVRDPNDVSDPYHPLNPAGSNRLLDPRLAAPDLPAGARVLDAFVCDGFGLFEDYDNNGIVTIDERNYQLTVPYGNALGFQGKGTPGLININTATPEVMRAAPHMDLLIHSDPNDSIPLSFMPPVALPLAIVHYRERFTGLIKDIFPLDDVETGYPNGANYLTRVLNDAPLIRGDRGMASIGEVMLLDKAAFVANQPPEAFPLGTSPVPPDWVDPEAWRVNFAGLNPFFILDDPAKGGSTGAFVSTDVGRDVRNGFDVAVSVIGDGVSEDVEEANLLFAGISNLITTRSDMFTVHFIIRSFRQNPITGIWDATDREQIVDERRYVMLVDRSEVNRPTDRPRILYFEKLPN